MTQTPNQTNPFDAVPEMRLEAGFLGFGLDSNFHPSGIRTVNSGVSLRL
jgi:hypothetical protein